MPTSKYICPCTGSHSNATVPPFIGNDYYCNSGVDSDPVKGVFYTTQLWTGEGCILPNFCCSRSGMPWICGTLSVPTTHYIELCNCYNGTPGNEDTTMDQIEIYARCVKIMLHHLFLHTYFLLFRQIATVYVCTQMLYIFSIMNI